MGARHVGLAWESLGQPACGWIVDLRGGGGNAWTLLMALAPLLGEGPSFGFRSRDGRTDTVSIQPDGSLAGGGRPPVPSPTDPGMPEALTGIPVAIVQARGTASAHEFALMAFAGRASTRSFGATTGGLPTARDGFEMSDGSVLQLTTALGVDRAGQAHETALVPDVTVADSLDLSPPPTNPTAPSTPPGLADGGSRLHLSRRRARAPGETLGVVGDEPRVPSELDATPEQDVAGAGHGAAGQAVSTSRVVRAPGRWSRLVLVVAVVGSVAAGLFWWVGDRGPEDGQSSANAGDARPTPVAFHEAVFRLVQNPSFAYEGEVHAAEQSPFRPGDWTARDVTVEGAVLMSHGLTRDVAVDATGRAVETVTSGPSVWTRTAPTSDGLGDAPWEFRSARGPAILGTAAVVDLILSATDPSEEAPDATGRRLIRATLPPVDTRQGYGDLLDDAELLLTLDVDGDIARIAVRSMQDDPGLVLELDIMRIGEPQAIAPPEDGDAGLRRTVPVDELEAVGVRPVELGRVPEGWELIGAWVAPAPTGPPECLRLHLSYRDPDAVSRGFMTLRVTTPPCGSMERGDGEPAPLTAGSFDGTVVHVASGLAGDLYDGTTRVGFLTDLSAEDAATVLASLRSFDAEREPASLASIPSD